MKNILTILCLTFCCLALQAQEKKELYFMLIKGAYFKHVSIRPVKIKTTRIDTAYSFFLPCNCEAGQLNFYHGNNPETGRVNLPIRKVTKKELKKMDLISLNELVQTMKANSDFNFKYNLFLVEGGKAYHVFSQISFGDYVNDVIGL